ncbi:MAG: hypothetical protein M3525_16220, partial [Acidobacteriota bacterium]|nr:hypothetical protein [Acidobacteriota bacterium]
CGMKISRTFVALIFAALILFAGAFYSAKTAQQIKDDEDIKCREELRSKVETQCVSRFFYSTTPEFNINYADYTAIGLFILAISTSMAAIWVRKFDD